MSKTSRVGGAESNVRDGNASHFKAAELGACEIDEGGRFIGCALCWSILGWADSGERVASLDQVLGIIRDQDRRKVEAAIARALTDDPRLEVVFHIDGDQRSRAIALRGSRSEVEGRRRLLCVMADITDLRRQQNEVRRSETRELIVRELGHRLRNLFPVILAMVKLTAQSQSSVGDYRTALERRLRALAAAERLLTRGASESAGIDELVRIEVAPFDGGDRHEITIAGPCLTLRGGMAQSFAMIVHELATNAVKHGALSVPDGKLDVTWRLEPGEDGEDELVFTWTERNGPSPKRPLRKGFGSMVLGESGTSLMGGRAERAFTESGYHYVMRAPYPAEAPSTRES